MVSTLLKSTLREIRQSLGRYLAIAAIILLGVGVYGGLKMSQPNMMATGVEYIDEQRLFDFRLLSTLGFTEEDVAAFAALEGVEAAQGAVYTDFITAWDDGKELVFTALSLTEGINLPALAAGWMPRNGGECLGDARFFSEEDLGRSITVASTNSEDTLDLLAYETYTLVGIIRSPYYLNGMDRGTSSIGGGTVSAFVYIPEDGFEFEAYYEIFVKLRDTEEGWSEAYDDRIDTIKSVMETLAEERADLRYQTIYDDALAELQDAERELADGWEEYRSEKADAEQELEDAYKELTDGEREYEDGLREIADGWQEYEDGLRELADGWQEYRDGVKEYEDGVKEVQDAEEELLDAEAELLDAEQELLDAKAELDDAKAELETAKTELDDAKEELESAEAELLDAKTELEAAEAELLEAEQELLDAKAELDAAKEELDAAEAELLEAEQELLDAKDELDAAGEELDILALQFQVIAEQLQEVKEELDAAEAQLQDAKEQLDAAKEDLDKGEAGYAQLNALHTSAAQIAAAVGMESPAQLIAALKSGAMPELNAAVDQMMQAQGSSLAAFLNAWDAAEASIGTQLNETYLTGLRATLDAGSEAYEKGLAEYEAGLAEHSAGAALYEENVAAFMEGYLAYLDGVAAFEAGCAEYEEGLAAYEEGKKQYEDGLAEYEDGLAQYEEGKTKYEDGLAEYEDGLAAYEEGYAEYEDGLAKYEEGKEKYEDGLAQYEEGYAEYEDGLAEYEKGLAEYEDGVSKLADAKAELLDAEQKLQDAEAELLDGEREIKDAEAELLDAEREIAEARVELDDGWTEYEDGKAEAEKEFADAEAELLDAEEEIADGYRELGDLQDPDIYVLTRQENAGYVSFENDTSIVAAVAVVFPVFFFLVAALVCVTTMTRMVDEQRTQIGVLKAMGYSNAQIMGKYIFYSGSAAVLGGAGGFALGTTLMPNIIWTIYGIMYDFAPMKFTFDPSLAVMTFGAAMLCSVGSTWCALRMELKEAAAELIRPKTPKAGRRVFLEYITPVWKRLSFLHKVSVRNVLRYRSRLIMMVLGIGGCTALLITGFGLKDSLTCVIDEQFEKITFFDFSVNFREEPTEEELAEYLDEKGWDEGLLVHSGSTDVVTDRGTRSVFLVISSEACVDGYLSLHNAEGEIAYPGAGEAVLNEGLAEKLGIRAGDEIRLRGDDGRTIYVTVSAICDNFVNNYVYIHEDTYKQATGEKPEYLTLWLHEREGRDPYADGALLSDWEDVSQVTVNAAARSQVRRMLERLDLLVVVVVVCAGALAFIVLYNLTNINITERVREIATIKVLGFYRKETAAYIFREINILAVLGSAAGLLMGKALHAFVMAQVSIDAVYFPTLIKTPSYVYAVALTIVFTQLISLVMRPRIAGICMAESLKSVE